MNRAAEPGGTAGYRRRRMLALGLLMVAVAGALVVAGREVLLRSARFQLAQVTVVGAAEVTPETVRAAAGLRTGVPLLTVDTDAARRGVAALSTVASARVVRRWPATVELRVTERTAVATAASPGGLRLVDRTGVAYRAAPAQAPPLPRLAAARVAPDDPATEAGLVVLAALPPAVRAQLQVVEAAGPRTVTLRLAGGKQVRWGAAEGSARKAAVLAVLLSQSGTVYDVSAPDLPTIRR